jgi:hypothetical protein
MVKSVTTVTDAVLPEMTAVHTAHKIVGRD